MVLRKLEKMIDHSRSRGFSAASAHRLIARVEEDGRATAAERGSIAQLLAQDVFERKGRGLGAPARRELSRYLAFAEQLEAPRPAPRLGRSLPDLDPRRYQRNVERLCGERAVRLPDGRRISFRDRYLPSPRNQLQEVAHWLAGQHRSLGLEVELQPVVFEGRRFVNVIASLPGESARAVLLADHYDVADKEQLGSHALRQLARDHGWTRAQIEARRDRVAVGEAVPGADDNASATAALLEAAHVLGAARAQGLRPSRTVRLLHLVGEELPADCLGARTYVARAQARGEAIDAVLVLDMIGVDRTGRRKVQLAPGAAEASLSLAAEVKHAIRALELPLVPVLRPHGSRKSFLHQTDGLHFSRAGYPTLLLNELVNDDHDRYRVGYHDEFDVPALMSFDYAADVARAAIEAVLALATQGGSR